MAIVIDPQLEASIVNSLANSVSPNNDLRHKAEETLKAASKAPGYATALLKISADISLRGKFEIDVNHAASIQFGRLVDIHWKFKDEKHALEVSA